MPRVMSLFILLSLIIRIPLSSTVDAPPPPPTQPADAETIELEQAIQKAITLHQEQLLLYLLYDTRIGEISISEDNTWAIAQLLPIDLQTGYIVPAEPGLVVLYKAQGNWQAILPDDPRWMNTLLDVPEALLSDEDKTTWLGMYQQAEGTSSTTVFSGYKLPWEAGQNLVLTRSISHYNPPNPIGSMHYAFDFAAWHDATGHSPMFEVRAAKAGHVKYARWMQENGDEASPGNYLVIEDLTTSPATYALYLHLAKDSIPVELRQAGAPVSQGQYIGMADDTGNSTGNHLHFQVHTNPYSYWGNSVDITFSDVSINGGRPRTPAEASNWPQYGSQGQVEYTSGNTPPGDQDPPEGDLYTPLPGFVQESSLLQVSGWANDNVALTSIQIKARYAGTWHDIGPAFSASPFNYQWDMCYNQVPDGPVSLYLDIRDSNGNTADGLPGLRHIIKQYECPSPPPACRPGQNQVALYSDPDFRGDCVLLNTGIHGGSDLGVVGNDNVESIQVGSQAWTTLFIGDQQGRGETFTRNDSNLMDNRIGANQLSSLVVRTSTTLPEAPALIYPSDIASFSGNSSLSLSWDDRGGGVEYQLNLDGEDKAWQSQPVYHLGSISNGSHNWKVRARNSGGPSVWSTTRTFTLQIPLLDEPAAPTITVPFTDTMENGENGWLRGEWDQTVEENHTPGGSVSFNYEINDQPADYDTGSPNSGYLTSPSISIPAPGYYLRFWYLYETEGNSPNWDQRWVQISVDGGAFLNILQLYNDPPNYWLQSPPIDLSPYAGHSIRARFLFETLDSAFNGYKGWYIDDFSVNRYDTPVCASDFEPDDSTSQARPLNYNDATTGEICPQGDEDFFRFSGQAGDLIGISANAAIPYTPDTTISLLDGDFASVLAENDDRITGILTDSYLSYRLARDGIYYIKTGAWNHPSAGGSEFDYTISLYGEDNTRPLAGITSPANSAWLPFGNVNILVSAEDQSIPGETATGISHVDFLWHSGDWINSDWIYLGSDWDSLDGWSYNFDTTDLPEQHRMALFVRVYDWAGNWRDVAIWNLWLDLNPKKTFLPLTSR